MLKRSVMVANARVEWRRGGLNGVLGQMLARCMKSCIDRQITGALVLDSRYFLTVLEGEDAELAGFTECMRSERGYQNLRVLENTPVTSREYTTWAVGATWSEAKPSLLIKKIQTVVPTASEVRAHVRTSICSGVLAETPPLVDAAA